MSATVWNAGTVGAAGIDSVAAEAAPETRKAATKPAAAKRIMRIVESPMGVIEARAIYAGSSRHILRPPVAPAGGGGSVGLGIGRISGHCLSYRLRSVLRDFARRDPYDLDGRADHVSR